MHFDWLKLEDVLGREQYRRHHDPDGVRASIAVSDELSSAYFATHNKRTEQKEPDSTVAASAGNAEASPAVRTSAETGPLEHGRGSRAQ